MACILTSPLKKIFPLLSTTSGLSIWPDIASQYLSAQKSTIQSLIERIDLSIDILEHQKERTSQIIGILEEAGGLTVRARNAMGTEEERIKFKYKVDEYADWFARALQKLDKAVHESEYKNINLMNGGSLITAFDENGKNTLTTLGHLLTTESLGIRQPNFSTPFTVQNARIDIMNALDITVTVRNTISDHLEKLAASRAFGIYSLSLAESGLPTIHDTQANNEITSLIGLGKKGNTIFEDNCIANPDQEITLNAFASSPDMEDK